jgi:hypothetical protein
MREFSSFKARVHRISTLGFLLATLLGGCGGGKKAADAAPTVQSVTPTAGATAVAVATLITATFGEAMNPTTISTSTFTVAGPAGAPVTGTVSISGNTATFTPAALLGGLVLPPGTYLAAGGAFLLTGWDLTLDA